MLRCASAVGGAADPGDVALEFRPVWDGEAVRAGAPLPPFADGVGWVVSRLDWLMADVALRREDGTWLESRDWQAFLSVGRRRLRAVLEGVPGRPFTAVRFSIGLPPAINGADPNQYPAGHALHPQENGLHWGWQGGYIFMALEGFVRGGGGADRGFSYHLANDENRVWVEVPVRFDGARHRTIRLRMDLARVLGGAGGVAPWRDGTSTHSRPGDPLAAKLRAALPDAFTVDGLSTDRFQELERGVGTNRLAAGPSPLFDLRVSARLPRVDVPADNPPTRDGVALGERLFHERRLSRDGTLSCAGCHQRGAAFADADKARSVGVDGQVGARNAMPLFNLAWQREFFWDGRVTGLRHQVLHPIADPREMGESVSNVVAKLRGAAGYPELFRRAFGDPRIDAGRLGLALEQYLLTLVSQNSRFDRAARNEIELTAEERRGLQLFITENDPARGLKGADCFHCHGGNLFTSGAFANNGLDAEFSDPGRAAVTKDESDRGRFKVPSLRNVAVTAPYMHDGRFKTLEEVVEHYNSGVRRSATLDPNLAKHPNLGLDLSPADRRALVAFLRALTDDDFLKTSATAALAAEPPTLPRQ